MSIIIDIFGNDYIKCWKKQSLKITKDEYLLIPSTKGTFWESGYMKDFMITSILSGTDIISREDIIKEKFDSSLSLWEKYGEKFIEKIIKLKRYDNLTESHCFCFETLCKNNQGLFNDYFHKEFTCLSSIDRIVFLGTSICEKRFFIPHFFCEQNVFTEPLIWKLNYSDEVIDILNDLNNLIIGKINEKAFLNSWPPINDNIINYNFTDYEGWVIMKKPLFPINDLDISIIQEKIKLDYFIYGKIKTVSYYNFHNVLKYIDNVLILCKYVKKTNFHVIETFRKIFDHSEFVLSFQRIGIEVIKLLTNYENIFLETLDLKKEKNKKIIKIFNEDDCNKKNSILLINLEHINKYLYDIFSKEFPLKYEINFKKIILHFKPWNINYIDKISKINIKEKILKDLIISIIKKIS